MKMWMKYVVLYAGVLACSACGVALVSDAEESRQSPYDLRCDGLQNPLGIDSLQPTFAWKLRDSSMGARQSAYEITVYSQSNPGKSTQNVVWDSGRVASSASIDVPYKGLALKPSTRYYWKVVVWDRNGVAYPASDSAWWETGLMSQSNWMGQWIGYEEPELHAVRNSGAQWITNTASERESTADTRHDFRYLLNVTKRVRSAVLYVTGENNAGAWINGEEVLKLQTKVAAFNNPWGGYQRIDLSRNIHPGRNSIAIEIVRYKWNAKQVSTLAPMSACIFLTRRRND